MWTETKTNDQFSSTGWIVKSSQIFCLRKDTCSKPKPRQNCIGHGLQLLVTPMTSFKTSLRNTRWATQYLSDVWLSTNGVLHVHCENLPSPMASSALQHWTACLQKEMATIRHWSVSLWRDLAGIPALSSINLHQATRLSFSSCESVAHELHW